MLLRESQWIKSVIEELDIPKQTPVLNFGSQRLSKLRYQKYIMQNVYGPISQKEWKLINFDLFPGEGVDISGNILDENIFSNLKDYNFQLVFVCNVLEHVSNIPELTKRIENLIPTGGNLIVSVPNSYPTHYDPIDNKFRPTCTELINLFPQCEVIKSEILVDETYSFYIKRNLNVSLKYVVRLLTPFYKPKRWLSQLEYLSFFERPFKVTVILLRKK